MTNKNYIDVVYESNKKPFTGYPEKLIKLLVKNTASKKNLKFSKWDAEEGNF